MSGWMLPPSTEVSTTKSDSTVPVPIHCAPLQDKESANAKETLQSNNPLSIFQKFTRSQTTQTFHFFSFEIFVLLIVSNKKSNRLKVKPSFKTMKTWSPQTDRNKHTTIIIYCTFALSASFQLFLVSVIDVENMYIIPAKSIL